MLKAQWDQAGSCSAGEVPCVLEHAASGAVWCHSSLTLLFSGEGQEWLAEIRSCAQLCLNAALGEGLGAADGSEAGSQKPPPCAGLIPAGEGDSAPLPSQVRPHLQSCPSPRAQHRKDVELLE